MARQLLLLAKIIPGVDDELDALAAGLSDALALRRFMAPNLSGRGLIHWSSWYDPWLMGDDLHPDDWPLPVAGRKVADAVWQLDLLTDWDPVQRAIGADYQWQEQTWLTWQLWQAYNAFKHCNDRAVLFYGRAVFGASLGDDELLGGTPRLQ